MSNAIRVAMAQLNLLVGDIPGNTDRIIETAIRARDELAADLVLFPELALSGYPPEDLLLRPSLELRIDQALKALQEQVSGITLVVGYPRYRNGALYNMLGVIRDGKVLTEYAKQCLPNYQVFDEKRYFVPGDTPGVVELYGHKIGLSVCEDIWHSAPVEQLKAEGVSLILNINASPFHGGKPAVRTEVIGQQARIASCPILYVNQVGGQDELVFDGGSQAVNAQGHPVFAGAFFEEALYALTVDLDSGQVTSEQPSCELPGFEKSVYDALVLGVRDYVRKNGFKGVVLGLSGGIDSAVTVAVAVDALGADAVEAVMMPFRYTSNISIEDAAEEAKLLGIRHSVISIEPMYESFMSALSEEFAGTDADTTEENLQARCRGVLLMAISNKKGYLVLTTGNKSEMAVGYSTLYGDMAGGFDVLKDVPKTLVYRLAEYRNSLSAVIPQRVITRPPSAELRPDQTD
ncbi:MAG: NAD+ synthase, partial [Oceanospirillales bacterium]|nr:NAD+ synthase [Oceanospirillales bacterium]